MDVLFREPFQLGRYRAKATKDRIYTFLGESLQTPHNNTKRRRLQPPASHPRVHVRRRGERQPGTATGIPQNGR